MTLGCSYVRNWGPNRSEGKNRGVGGAARFDRGGLVGCQGVHQGEVRGIDDVTCFISRRGVGKQVRLEDCLQEKQGD